MKIVYGNKRLLDKGELAQLMIIIAGLAVAAVVAIGLFASVLLNKGEAAAGCISQSSGFKSGSDSARECRNMEEEANVASKGVIAGSFGSAEQSKAATGSAKKIAMQKEEFIKFSEALEKYREENGSYPTTKAQTVNMNYSSNGEAFSDFEYNFHYCPSPDGKNYVAAGYSNSPDNKGMYITYISNASNTPRSYHTNAKEATRVNEKNEDIRSGSWCYNSVDGSVADRAGVTGIGGDMTPMGDNRFIIPKPGWSGINPQNTGFVNVKK